MVWCDGVATYKPVLLLNPKIWCFPPLWAGGCSTALHDARPPCEVEKYFYFVLEKSFTDFAPCWTVLVLGKILFLFLTALNLKTFDKQILTTPKRSNLSSCSKLIPACLRKGAESSRIQELASNFNGKGITDENTCHCRQNSIYQDCRYKHLTLKTKKRCNLQEKREQMSKRRREGIVVVESVEKLGDNEATAMCWSCLVNLG